MSVCACLIEEDEHQNKDTIYYTERDKKQLTDGRQSSMLPYILLGFCTFLQPGLPLNQQTRSHKAATEPWRDIRDEREK